MEKTKMGYDKNVFLFCPHLADNFIGIALLPYCVIALFFFIRVVRAIRCLGRADARPSQESLLPIFQDSSIPLFLSKLLPRLFQLRWRRASLSRGVGIQFSN